VIGFDGGKTTPLLFIFNKRNHSRRRGIDFIAVNVNGFNSINPEEKQMNNVRPLLIVRHTESS